jgi:hypothetical protein
MRDHKLEPEATEVRRLEVITGTGRRRQFTADFKAGLVEETPQQPQRLRSAQRIGPSGRGPPDVSNHHQPFRWLPGAVVQRPRRLPVATGIALPITIGSVRYPGIKIHDVRVIRLFEVLLHGGTPEGDRCRAARHPRPYARAVFLHPTIKAKRGGRRVPITSGQARGRTVQGTPYSPTKRSGRRRSHQAGYEVVTDNFLLCA